MLIQHTSNYQGGVQEDCRHEINLRPMLKVFVSSQNFTAEIIIIIFNYLRPRTVLLKLYSAHFCRAVSLI